MIHMDYGYFYNMIDTTADNTANNNAAILKKLQDCD